MWRMKILTNCPPPPKRNKNARLTDELKSMKSGQSVVVEPEVALALVAYKRYHGEESRRKSVDGGKVQVWII